MEGSRIWLPRKKKRGDPRATAEGFPFACGLFDSGEEGNTYRGKSSRELGGKKRSRGGTSS